MQVRESRRQKHIRNARQFLDAADRLFDAGDYIQTSEKLCSEGTLRTPGLAARLPTSASLRRNRRRARVHRLS